MNSRPLKRARQACENCRRKKTRCSGERPICEFCARLQQDCQYDDSWLVPLQASKSDAFVATLAPRPTDHTLAARLATIESRFDALEPLSTPYASDENLDLPSAVWDGPAAGVSGEAPPTNTSQDKFTSLPSSEIIQSLINTYFLSCHCQPYCYFHEASFRGRVAGNTLPTWLLLAVLATASEFSDEPFFQGQQTTAADSYASMAWRDISDNLFQEDDFMDLNAVQATNLLSVIDFSAGRYKQAWVKIGLAVRFAEALDLKSEPDHSLPVWQQEEHRITFWSVYLLDRIVSCSPERTPTIQDADCTIGLPVGDAGPASSFAVQDYTTLTRLVDQLDDMSQVGYSGFLCLIASTLGRIQRYTLRRSVPAGSYLPWNSQSEFASIYSTLLTFESYSPAALTDFDSVLEAESVKMGEGYSSRPELGILASSHALYYLCQCLLHHPFLIRHRLQFVKAPIPPSFLKDILRKSRDNAMSLTLLLQSLLRRRLCLSSSIGYCAVIAGGIHRIFEHDDDPSVKASARIFYKLSLDFLKSAPVRWRHYPRMEEALANFMPDPTATTAMISPSICTSLPPHPDTDEIWRLLDYGRLSQVARESTSQRQTARSESVDSYDWTQVLEIPPDWIE